MYASGHGIHLAANSIGSVSPACLATGRRIAGWAGSDAHDGPRDLPPLPLRACGCFEVDVMHVVIPATQVILGVERRLGEMLHGPGVVGSSESAQAIFALVADGLSHASMIARRPNWLIK